MLFIEIKKQTVLNLKRLRHLRTIGCEKNHGVGAITVVIDFVIGDFGRTVRAVRRQFQMSKRVSNNLRVLGFHLAPLDIAIEIGIQTDCVIQIAQCDIPLALQLRLVAVNGEVTVAGLVCLRRARKQYCNKEKCKTNDGHEATQKIEFKKLYCLDVIANLRWQKSAKVQQYRWQNQQIQ